MRRERKMPVPPRNYKVTVECSGEVTDVKYFSAARTCQVLRQLAEDTDFWPPKLNRIIIEKIRVVELKEHEDKQKEEKKL